MKFIYTVALLFSMHANGQSGSDSLEYRINEVIRLKHAYEASPKLANLKRAHEASQELYNLVKGNYIKAGGKSSADSAFREYLNAIGLIRQNKTIYQSFLERMLHSKDTSILRERFVAYNYEDPFSSIREKENTIAKLAYYKIVKHFILELNRTALPGLGEATQFINGDKR